MDARRALREARRQAQEMAAPDIAKEPESIHEQMGMFERPETNSLSVAANRTNVSDNSFKQHDLIPMANSAEDDRDRDYPRESDRGVAYTHMDLQNHDVSVFGNILARLRTNTQCFVGQAGFQSDFSETNNPPGAPGNSVTLHNGNVRDQVSGGQHGLAHPVGTKPAQHDSYCSAPLSATPPNGSHSTSGSVTSNAGKMSRMDIMKAAMRGEL